MMDAKLVRLKHKDYLFPCVANYYAEPLVVASAHGLKVKDADGREYLDFFGGILTISVGHCNEKVTARMTEQMRSLQHTSTLYPTQPMVDLAERLSTIAPGNTGKKVGGERRWKSFFTSSGTEADETAVLLSKLHTGSSEIIALRHGYSGRSTLAINLTAHAGWRLMGSNIPGIKHAHAPYCYRCDFGLEYPSCGVKCAQDIEKLIQTETQGRIAAFLAEPIMGVGGFITPPKEYFSIAVEIVRKYGGLFIDDEVQTGWGRTGKKMWGIDHWGVVPDVVTSAKGMANGAPIGLTMAPAEVADSFKGSSIATFGGNPVSMAAALATLAVIDEEKLTENAHTVGEHLRGHLGRLAEKHPCIGEVRGMGLMQAMELVEDRKSKAPAAPLTVRVMEEARKLGLLIGKGGLYGNVLRIAPPMIATQGEVDDAMGLLDRALTAAASPARG
jgi:4-aminobutyrate aminotransferase-like enzyme